MCVLVWHQMVPFKIVKAGNGDAWVEVCTFAPLLSASMGPFVPDHA